MEEFSMPPEELTRLAKAAGFSAAGIASVEPLASGNGSSYFENWIDAGRAGEMEYLKRRNDDGQLLRSELQAAFPWARSVIVCAANYNADAPRSVDEAASGTGWIARYAWTGRTDPETPENPNPEQQPSDYHDVLLTRLRLLESRLKDLAGPFESRSYVDTGPVIERAYAQSAGVGWTGKNTCTLNQGLGSWLFLGVIVTSLSVSREARPIPAQDRCGTCRRCIDACPTDALVAPREMDASLCISYLTIEKRGEIPEELRAPIGRQIFGCDICQDVCPWNRKAPHSNDAGLAPRRQLVNPALEWLAELEPQSFNRLFRNSPVKRTKYAGFQRNVAIAMGNSRMPKFLPKLQEWSLSTDPALSGAAQWALARLSVSTETNGLRAGEAV